MHQASKPKSSTPRSGSSKDPTNRYIRTHKTYPKAYLRRKGSGAGRKFTSKVSKSNTLPIQISLILVKTSGGTTSAGIWFRSLSVLYNVMHDDQEYYKLLHHCDSFCNYSGCFFNEYLSWIQNYIHIWNKNWRSLDKSIMGSLA